jgi:hypothetical protein
MQADVPGIADTVQMLREKDFDSPLLSKAVNVDPSLVNRN